MVPEQVFMVRPTYHEEHGIPVITSLHFPLPQGSWENAKASFFASFRGEVLVPLHVGRAATLVDGKKLPVNGRMVQCHGNTKGFDEVMMKPVTRRQLRSYPQKAIDRLMNSLRRLNSMATGPSWASMHPSYARGTTRVPSRDRTNARPYRQIRLQAWIERAC